ncbi:MAG: hypothetical protein JEZ00_19365 [Anaerolineaceae bacterium]|nr:hypothetical protein [Anaerolineaceae bacterium]
MVNEDRPIEIAWKIWAECLLGNDRNSIFQQISSMIWDTAIFRIVVESRQIQIESNQKNPKINGAYHSFIDRNYFQSQVACIRRLLDNSYPLTKKKAVYSLYSLIKDVRKYREELNREKFLALRDMPYDYSEIKEKENTFFTQQTIGEGFFKPPELDWESIEEVHQLFDRLSGKTPETRHTDDVISDIVFMKLIEKLDEGNVISTYVDKFVAHSAAPESRDDLNSKNSNVTFEQLWKVHRNIYDPDSTSPNQSNCEIWLMAPL